MPRLRNASACVKAVDKALQWLDPHFESKDEWDSKPYPLVTYHKMPYLLAITGRLEECARALAWIKANLSAPGGHLNASSAASAPEQAGRASVREEVWVFLAAHLTGRYDMSLPLARTIAERQGRVCGGVRNAPSNGDDNSADVRTTSSAGIAFLAARMLPEARIAGRFVARAIQLQAESDKFYVRLDSSYRPVTKFDRGDAMTHVVPRANAKKDFAYLGAPIVFLSKLHLATGEPEWLDAAMDYFVYADKSGCADSVCCGTAVVGWGAAALYGITRRRLYYDCAEKVVQKWIDAQKSDGSWRAFGRARDETAAIAQTAETAMCLLESLREAQ